MPPLAEYLPRLQIIVRTSLPYHLNPPKMHTVPTTSMTPPPQRRPPPISIPSLLPSRKLFERVPVTNSTLQAYQAMRGNNDRNTIKHGPLYDNLHFFPRDDPLQYRDAKINLPAFPRGLDAGLPPNLLSSWDPPDEDCSHIRQTLGNDTSNPVSQRSQNQATSGRLRRNHYSGSEGFANYGYTSINGKWVDPDSPGELFIALTMSEELSPTDPLHLAKGPHVLSDEEADAFYQEYVTNLVEGEDCEGDPRSLRISPSTFAKWATGATSGDQYAPTYVEAPQVSVSQMATSPFIPYQLLMDDATSLPTVEGFISAVPGLRKLVARCNLTLRPDLYYPTHTIRHVVLAHCSALKALT